MKRHSFFSIIVLCVFCLTITPVLAGDSTEKKIKVYPNPADRGVLMTIDLPDEYREMTVILYNTVGKVIHTFKSPNKKIEFYAPDVSGIYLLRFVEKQKVVAVEKIIVKE